VLRGGRREDIDGGVRRSTGGVVVSELWYLLGLEKGELHKGGEGG